MPAFVPVVVDIFVLATCVNEILFENMIPGGVLFLESIGSNDSDKLRLAVVCCWVVSCVGATDTDLDLVGRPGTSPAAREFCGCLLLATKG